MTTGLEHDVPGARPRLSTPSLLHLLSSSADHHPARRPPHLSLSLPLRWRGRAEVATRRSRLHCRMPRARQTSAHATQVQHAPASQRAVGSRRAVAGGGGTTGHATTKHARKDIICCLLLNRVVADGARLVGSDRPRRHVRRCHPVRRSRRASAGSRRVAVPALIVGWSASGAAEGAHHGGRGEDGGRSAAHAAAAATRPIVAPRCSSAYTGVRP